MINKSIFPQRLQVGDYVKDYYCIALKNHHTQALAKLFTQSKRQLVRKIQFIHLHSMV